MTKALFFDIDGTLVSFETHDIPASTIEALAQARARGHRIFIATGRPAVLINNLGPLQQRGLIDGYITMNGSYCFVGNEVIYKNPIPHEDVCTIVNYCAEHHIACAVVSEHDICVCQANENIRFIFHEFLKTDALRESTPEAAIREPIFQLTPFVSTEQEAELLPHSPHSIAARWHPAFADVTAVGNTKQRGIDEIIRHFGIDLKDTIAFGDGGNDVSMLRHAAIGVAMGNAAPEVQREADYVTSSVDEDGIALAMKRFGLI